jgi:hypothetical protein
VVLALAVKERYGPSIGLVFAATEELSAAVNGVPLNVQLLKLLIPVPETPVTVTPDGNTSLIVTLVPEAIFPVLPI